MEFKQLEELQKTGSISRRMGNLKAKESLQEFLNNKKNKYF